MKLKKMSKKSWIWIKALGVLWLGTTGCSGPRAFTKGEYDDPQRVELLDDQFNESDMHQMAKTVIGALANCAAVRKAPQPPVVMIDTIANKTQEHIDTVAIANQIKRAPVQDGSLLFVNKAARELLEGEYRYQKEGGAVDQKTAKRSGKQIGADYVLNGQIMTRVQEVGADKFVYYQLTVDLTHLETSVIHCTENVEIRKKFKKRRISL